MADNLTPQDELFARLLNYMEKNQAFMEKALKGDTLEKTPANTTTANSLYGPAGLFSTPGLDRTVITAHMKPIPGLSSTVPLNPNVDFDPRFASITGFTGASGTSNTYACGDAPSAFMKGCNLTARFGRVRVDTNTIDFDDTMRRINRGVMTDLNLAGSVLGGSNLIPGNIKQNDVLNTMTAAEMVIAGVTTERELSRQLWQGVYGHNSIFGPEFPGLDVQIATGQKDADTSVLCPALDSDVKQGNYQLIGAWIVEYISMLEFYVRHNAEQMGLMPVEWVWFMRPEMWQELTEVWPCAYNTNRCAQTANLWGTQTQVTIDGRQNIAERDSMRSSMTIDVNGHNYRVVLDDGIYEQDSTNDANLAKGQFASTIYFVPLTAAGFPVLYREYVDYRLGGLDLNTLPDGLGQYKVFWTDSGVFSWTTEFVKWCYKASLKTEQRIILRTPQLAGRIDDVKIEPLQHIRSSDPASSYFKDGGVSIRAGLAAPKAIWG